MGELLDGLAVLAGAALQATLAVNTVPGSASGERAELLDVAVDQLAGVAALVAIGRIEM